MPIPYDHSHYVNADDYFREHGEPAERLANFTSLIRRAHAFGASEPMLDIGCGRGESLAAARGLGWAARGVEPSAEFAATGARDLGVEIDVGEVAGRYESSSFGLVLLSGVLEHVYSPLDLLAEANRVLRPGGVLYVDVPNERSFLHRCARMALLASGRNWTLSLSPTFSPFHVVGWSPKPLRHSLDRAGFSDVRLEGYPLRWIGGQVGLLVERALAPLRLSAGLIAWARRGTPP